MIIIYAIRKLKRPFVFFQTEKMNLGNDVISWLDFDFKKNPKLNFYSNKSLLKRL